MTVTYESRLQDIQLTGDSFRKLAQGYRFREPKAVLATKMIPKEEIEETLRAYQIHQLLASAPGDDAWGTTHQMYWKRISQYCDILSSRSDVPNASEVYTLLSQNALNLSNGEPVTIAEDRFGDQATEYAKRGFVVPRNRHFADENGRSVNDFGGVTDGQYINDRSYLEALVGVTFGLEATKGIAERSVDTALTYMTLR